MRNYLYLCRHISIYSFMYWVAKILRIKRVQKLGDVLSQTSQFSWRGRWYERVQWSRTREFLLLSFPATVGSSSCRLILPDSVHFLESFPIIEDWWAPRKDHGHAYYIYNVTLSWILVLALWISQPRPLITVHIMIRCEFCTTMNAKNDDNTHLIMISRKYPCPLDNMTKIINCK